MKISKFIILTALTTLFITGCGSQKDEKENKDQSNSIQNVDSSNKNTEVTMRGDFQGENDHSVSGKAVISNGKLTLSNFKTDDGPDLHVYLSKNGKIEGAKELDKIDLEKSEQTFDLEEKDSETYTTVLIYCNKAHELFGKAAL